MASTRIPSQAAPVGLGSTNGQRVNGVLFDAATAAQRNVWITDNQDRVLIGSSNSANLVAGNFASSMLNITGGNGVVGRADQSHEALGQEAVVPAGSDRSS